MLPVGSLTCFRELKQQSILAIPRYMQIEQMSLVQDLTYTLVILTSGVLGCSGGPLSPKMILPEKSKSKHMEKEFCVTPCLAMVLGTEISDTPSPRRPSDPVSCRKLPVWLVPHPNVTFAVVLGAPEPLLTSGINCMTSWTRMPEVLVFGVT
jgi:hypothetical protein